MKEVSTKRGDPMPIFRNAVVALIVISGLAAGASSAAGTMTISLPLRAKIIARSEVDVPLSVSCAPLDNQTDGSVELHLVQVAGSKTTSATAEAPIVCDGQNHNSVVALVTSDGRWHNGEATATASGDADGWQSITVCAPNSDGVVQCTTGTASQHDEGTAGPVTVALENG
jgi:hypothetical protein